MKTLIIDNYDSFTYNLYQYIGSLGGNPTVVRNDATTLSDIKKKEYSHIVISPGPGTVTDRAYFGVCTQVITELGPTIPLLGVCLGHQGIIHAFGGKIVHADLPMHGKKSVIRHGNQDILKGIQNPLLAMRYHSLVGEEESLPICLEVTARATDDGAIMGIMHTKFPISGIQFHPESIGTRHGKAILKNFLSSGLKRGRL